MKRFLGKVIVLAGAACAILGFTVPSIRAGVSTSPTPQIIPKVSESTPLYLEHALVADNQSTANQYSDHFSHYSHESHSSHYSGY